MVQRCGTTAVKKWQSSSETAGREVSSPRERGAPARTFPLADVLSVFPARAGVPLQHLGFAQMVWKEGNGVYRLSPLISGFRTPADQLAAIGTMDDDDRFDHPDFQERYERRVAQHEKERQEKAARRQRPAEPPIDLASRRKR